MKVRQGRGENIAPPNPMFEPTYPWADMVAEFDESLPTRPFFRVGTSEDPCDKKVATTVQSAGLRWLERNGFDRYKISRRRTTDPNVTVFYLLLKGEDVEDLA